MNSKTRTFIAIVPGTEILERAERALLRLRRLTDSVKWVERLNLHWTLHFLGELNDQEVYEVCQAAERAVAGYEPFGLTARGVGAFPTIDRPKTMWMGVEAGRIELRELYSALEVELQPLGIRSETRRYVPHLTLGRAGRSIRPAESTAITTELQKLAEFDGGSQIVDELTVYASRLRREGPHYTPLATVRLDS